MRTRICVGCLILASLFVTMRFASAQGEVDCDDAPRIAEGLQSTLEDVETLDNLLGIAVALRYVFTQCDHPFASMAFGPIATETISITPTPAIVEPGYTRSKPLPLGEWIQISDGRVRIVSVEENYEPPDGVPFRAPPGTKIIAVNLEYFCEKEDENEVCRGAEVGDGSYITVDGVVIENAPIWDRRNISVLAPGHEVYAGVTIKGSTYFVIQEDEMPHLLRLSRWPALFFSLN